MYRLFLEQVTDVNVLEKYTHHDLSRKLYPTTAKYELLCAVQNL
jgi:hypothetical protein